MSILLSKDSRVIFQGITGKAGTFHAQQCLEYGTNIVGGVTPGKGGVAWDAGDGSTRPVFNTVAEALKKTKANVSCVFVPPSVAADSILEAIDAKIPLIIAITEGIPVRDMMEVKAKLAHSKSILIGPNCPGVIVPGVAKVGIMPGYIHKPGSVGIISRSGTLTYEAVWQLTSQGIGQSACVGIGGDPIIGSTHLDIVKRFNDDPGTSAILMIGEIGGTAEIEAAQFMHKHGKKPMAAFIAGTCAPKGKRMGHAGAIVSGANESAQAKIEFLKSCGVQCAATPADMAQAVMRIAEQNGLTLQ